MKTIRSSKEAGFSMVELIIVVALIAVVSGLGVNMSGILSGRRAYATSEKITELLMRTKTETLAWSRATPLHTGEEMDVSLHLHRTSTGIYGTLQVLEETEEVLLNSDRVTVTVFLADGRDEALRNVTSRIVTEDETVRIGFDKKTGAFLPGEDGQYVKRIVVEEDDRRYVIRLVPATGYVYAQTTETVQQTNTEGSH